MSGPPCPCYAPSVPVLFQHRLTPVRDALAMYEASGTDPSAWYLASRYALSEGWYWLTTPAGDLPTTHTRFAHQHQLTGETALHLDYQVARLWMDLQVTLPAVLEPLPEPFAQWVASGNWAQWQEDVNAWRAAEEGKDATVYDTLFTARRWWWARHLDMGYLSVPPTIRFWRIGDTVTLEWDTRNCEIDGVPCWVESMGRQNFSLEAFEGEMDGFHERLSVDMQVQLQALMALGLVDAEGLASLQL